MSPVFQDKPAAAGSLRLLPGNVIVYLEPQWEGDKIRRWIERGGFEVIKKLAIRPNAFILKTEPGMQSLIIANRLYESGEVIAAFPDWWLETALR